MKATGARTEERIIKTQKDRQNTLSAHKQLWNLNENTNLILISQKSVYFLMGLFIKYKILNLIKDPLAIIGEKTRK